MSNGPEAYGHCRHCRSGNYRTCAACSWSKENPDAARSGIDPPCYHHQDYLRGQESLRTQRNWSWLFFIAVVIGLSLIGWAAS